VAAKTLAGRFRELNGMLVALAIFCVIKLALF